MVETFKEHFFRTHKVSGFLVAALIILSSILKQWILLVIELILFPTLYLILYHHYKKFEIEYEEQTRKSTQKGISK